ncbi:hypothetical protein SELMODRAFT_428854 [Selaginella moellendorffii]|uniref:Uncharacterized protein n=1 Tax=Selaginella moellendorffii TaxID=88036 RepID=D8T481_SELML|nr:hypothetical protein SELMODRAFT_428854 [Selaginella moellendorffii]
MSPAIYGSLRNFLMILNSTTSMAVLAKLHSMSATGAKKCLIVELRANFKYVDGDGTVPSKSSKDVGFTTTVRHRVPGNHRSLLRSNEVFLLLKDILEIKDEEKKLVVHTALHKSKEVIEKQARSCLSDTAISHKNSTWDTNSEDTQDYNSGSKSEDNTENSVVFTINTEDARAQAHGRATHKGFELHHLSISATDRCCRRK